jgi:hypothetical protein
MFLHHTIATEGTPLPSLSNLQVVPTATAINITWTASGDIEHFNVTYGHTVNRCSDPPGDPTTETISDGSMRMHTLTDLNEDSNYTIVVRAINPQGYAEATTTSGILLQSIHSIQQICPLRWVIARVYTSTAKKSYLRCIKLTCILSM